MNSLPSDTLSISDSDIAIIGMSCRWPGANNSEAFWQRLIDGVEMVSFFSDEELLMAGVAPSVLENPNYVKAGTVLDGVEQFDAAFFGVSAREAEILDPQHRWFLMEAVHALETAGYYSDREKALIGVYAGADANTYLPNNLYGNRDFWNAADKLQVLIGNEKDYLSTRVSYKLNLKGPSVGVQTACSTSLVAVHLACQGLLMGDCDIALAGGVTIHLPQHTGYWYQEGSIFSPDGHCRTFDAKARGTVDGKGLGIVVLKRLADALADGDYIHAVVKGSAINNDGSADKVGYTAPSVRGQSTVITEALAMANVSAETITYVETHGTGTRLGDPIEMAALTQAFRAQTPKTGFCAVGSVKTNMGHAQAAAGVASLIKTVLALEHRLLPPSLHFEQPNPEIDFANSPFVVNTTLSEWNPKQLPRRAGVSSFGMGGTNAHVILEEAPVREPSGPASPWQLLMLSAKTASALEQMTANLAAHLEQHPELNLADVAYTLCRGRPAFSHRRIVVGHHLESAITAIRQLSPTAVVTGRQKDRTWSVVLMFAGQGSQYVRMAEEIYQTEPVFREQVDFGATFLKPLLGIDLRQILYPGDEIAVTTATPALNQTAIAQTALFVIEYALAQLWMSWGIKPQVMIGHSIGEYVAACLAGVFSLEEALSLVATRGQLMQSLPSGSMLAVSLSESAIQPWLTQKRSLAAINGPSRCVVAGETPVIESLESQLTAQGIECRRLHTSHAFHSEMMTPILSAFTTRVKQVKLKPPKIPYLSNVTGTWITAEQATNPSYWANHLRQTVRFSDGLQQLLKENSTQIWLEVGPGHSLSTLTRQHLQPTTESVVLSSLRQPQDSQSDRAFLLKTLGKIWLLGGQIDWSAFYAHEHRHRLPLPTYPFEGQRYWVAPSPWSESSVQVATTLNKLGQAVFEACTQQAENSLLALANLIAHYSAKRQSLDQLCLAYMKRTLNELGAFTRDDDRYSTATFCQQLQIDPRYQQLVSHWLTVLVEKGELQREGAIITHLRPVKIEVVEALEKEVKAQWQNDYEWHNIRSFNAHWIAILRGQREPRELFFAAADSAPNSSENHQLPESLLFANYNAIMRAGIQRLLKLLPTTVNLRILEIGAGTGITTAALLPILPANRTHYTYTDVTQFFLNQAQPKFSGYPFVQYRLLNVEQSPTAQGYEPHSFDLVIATLMLHTTKQVVTTLQHVHSLLAPGGLFFLWEITQPQLDFELTYSFLMQSLEDGERNQGNPFLSKEQWCQALQAHGFSVVASFPQTEVLEHHIVVAQADNPPIPAFMNLVVPVEIHATPVQTGPRFGSSSQTYVAPRNEIEKTITQVWQQQLGVEFIGIHDNFFELGGDSLIALPLLIQLREAVQTALSPQSLLQAPTIAQLAQLISGDRAAVNLSTQPSEPVVSSSLVAIRSTGANRPLFCVHPIGGNALCYAKLAQYLGDEQPVYGLVAKGLDGKEAPLVDIKAMATEYVKVLPMVQPKGPYVLLGWSFGGMVAFEMALQLRQQGKAVALFVIDIGAPMNGLKIGHLEDTMLLALFAADLGIWAHQEITSLLETLRGFESLDQQLHYLLTQAKHAQVLPATADIQDIQPLIQVFKTNFRALQNYVPKGQLNQMTLFRAEDLIFSRGSGLFDIVLIDSLIPYAGWNQFVLETVEVHTIPGNHYTSMADPHVKHLAAQLKRCLAQLQVDYTENK